MNTAAAGGPLACWVPNAPSMGSELKNSTRPSTRYAVTVPACLPAGPAG